MEVYAARPFRLGDLPNAETAPAMRIVFDYIDGADEPATRFSLMLGDILRLVRQLERLVAAVDAAPPG